MNSLFLSSVLFVCLVAGHVIGGPVGGHYSESKEDCKTRAAEKVQIDKETFQHYLIKKSNYFASMWDTIYSTKIADKNLFEDLKAQLKKIVTEIQVNGSDCLNEAEQWGKAALSTGCHLENDKWLTIYADEVDAENKLRTCFTSSLKQLTVEIERLVPADLKN